MQIRIAQEHEGLIQRAVASGEARDPDQFVNELIHRYSDQRRRQQDVEAVLTASLDSGEIDDEAGDRIAHLREGLRQRLQRDQA